MILRAEQLPGLRELALAVSLGAFSWPVWAAEKAPKRTYQVPSLDEIARVDDKGRGKVGIRARRQSLYAYRVKAHPVSGDNYVIVTDHVEEEFLEPLRRLVSFHKGSLLMGKDFGALSKDAKKREELLAELKTRQARYIAIAPRRESFHENVVLAFMDMVAAIDDDPELDAFPAWLVAPDAKSFARLIEQSISFQPSERNEIKPFTLCQVSAKEFRSQQKACIMDDYFNKMGVEMPSLSVRIKAPKITSELYSAVGDVDDRVIGTAGGGNLLASVPSQSLLAMEKASLLMVYGHGAPGRICGLSLKAFGKVDCSGKFVLCGACFTALPVASDFPRLQQGPDGEPVFHSRERFADRVLRQGAVGVLAHMRLSDGFPSVLPVFESMMQGLTVGESVQRLLNAAIVRQGMQRGQFTLAEADKEKREAQQQRNALLWVMIGDPALRMVRQVQ